MAQPRVGVQLIVFGERARTDLAGTLKAVAAAGYDGFEMGTMSNDQQLAEARAARDAAGLVCAGCHTGVDALKDPQQVKTLIHYTKAIGADFLISSGRSDWKTLDEYLEGAKVLSQAGQQCREAGVTFCYHNHHWEFRKINGQTPIHVMITATDPNLVKLCPDVYWIHAGGERPADFVSCYRDRIPYYHFKDGTGDDQNREVRELGTGDVDLPAALRAALATNPAWVTTEQDRTKLDPAESVKISRDYLKTLGL